MTDRRPVGTFLAHRAPRAEVVAAIAMVCCAAALAEAAGPYPTADHIMLVSTRAIGPRCNDAAMSALRYEEFVRPFQGPGDWRPLSPAEAAAALSQPLPTVVYVHGNRVASGADKAMGLAMYHSLGRPANHAPIRFIIWSWPSTRIPGPIKDYQVKAALTRPAGWQLAWTVDRLPTETPLAMVGYSYGARVVTGALHLLAGGRLNELALSSRTQPTRPLVRTALVAAAEDSAWLQPGGYHGRALEQMERLLLINNQRDPAMRFYRISPIGHSPALGFAGLNRAHLGPLGARVESVDVTGAVGRHHTLSEYLTAGGSVNRVLERVAQFPSLRPLPPLVEQPAPMVGGAAAGGQ